MHSVDMLVGCMSLVNSSTHFRCLSLQSCVKTEEIEEKLAEEIADNLSAPHLAQAEQKQNVIGLA